MPTPRGRRPPLLSEEGLVYRTICFEGRCPGVAWPLGWVRLRREGTGRSERGEGGKVGKEEFSARERSLVPGSRAHRLADSIIEFMEEQ